ncbi:hypothetical protein PMAYCL1PPCAC_24686, partial [Pristionchus mayeri]
CTIKTRKPLVIEKDGDGHFSSAMFFFKTVFILWREKQRADLKWCLQQSKARCYVGNGCVNGMTETHKEFSLINKELKLVLQKDAKMMKQVIECDVGAIVEVAGDKSPWPFYFHSNRANDNVVLTINTIHTSSDPRIVYVDKGELECYGGCTIDVQHRNSNNSSFFWTGKIHYA